MKKYLQILKLVFISAVISTSLVGQANAATQMNKNVAKSQTSKQIKLLQIAAVNLPVVLRKILRSGDVFQGYNEVVYRNVSALKLRIFNQKTGRVRYVYVSVKSGQVL